VPSRLRIVSLVAGDTSPTFGTDPGKELRKTNAVFDYAKNTHGKVRVNGQDFFGNRVELQLDPDLSLSRAWASNEIFLGIRPRSASRANQTLASPDCQLV